MLSVLSPSWTIYVVRYWNSIQTYPVFWAESGPTGICWSWGSGVLSWDSQRLTALLSLAGLLTFINTHNVLTWPKKKSIGVKSGPSSMFALQGLVLWPPRSLALIPMDFFIFWPIYRHFERWENFELCPFNTKKCCCGFIFHAGYPPMHSWLSDVCRSTNGSYHIETY